jgi:hypothetical protein
MPADQGGESGLSFRAAGQDRNRRVADRAFRRQQRRASVSLAQSLAGGHETAAPTMHV